jgi:hypothetical protein
MRHTIQFGNLITTRACVLLSVVLVGFLLLGQTPTSASGLFEDRATTDASRTPPPPPPPVACTLSFTNVQARAVNPVPAGIRRPPAGNSLVLITGRGVTNIASHDPVSTTFTVYKKGPNGIYGPVRLTAALNANGTTNRTGYFYAQPGAYRVSYLATCQKGDTGSTTRDFNV